MGFALLMNRLKCHICSCFCWADCCWRLTGKPCFGGSVPGVTPRCASFSRCNKFIGRGSIYSCAIFHGLSDGYFRKTTPELVETHSPWAQQSRLYEHHLLDGYAIVASNGVRYFLRRDLYDLLRAEYPAKEAAVAQSPGCLHRERGDLKFSLEHETCLVLNSPGISHNLK